MARALKDYAAPIVALDKIIWLDVSRITTQKAITGNEAFFEGHYPGYPIYPGVFIIEAVHQAVRYYAAKSHNFVRLVEVCSTRFISPLYPGDILEVNCEFHLQPDNQTLVVKAICSNKKGKVAEVKLEYSVGNSL
jgi:3-hydroxyacyl-[acyl-carrier-protein] dehydratase